MSEKKWKKRAKQAEKAMKKAYRVTQGKVKLNPVFGPHSSKEYGIYLVEYYKGEREMLIHVREILNRIRQERDLLLERNTRLEDFVDLSLAREKAFPHAWTEECDSENLKLNRCPKCITGEAYDAELKATKEEWAAEFYSNVRVQGEMS